MALINGPNWDHMDTQPAAGGNMTRHKLQDTDGRSMIAPTEASSTASSAHAVGSYFIYNNNLYRTTVPIAVGGTITPGTNCTQTQVGEFMKANEVATVQETLSYLGIS